jgi:hypothetical protein
VDYDKSLLSLVGRTFDRDGVRCWEYFHWKDNYETIVAMCQACDEHVSLWRYDGSKCYGLLWITISHCFHWWVELLIEMELDVGNTFIGKTTTRR